MTVGLDERTRTYLSREVAFLVAVLLFALAPTFAELGAIAWMAVGVLFAFAAVHPRALIFAVPFAIPMSFRPFDLGSFQLNILEVLVLAAAVGYAPRIILGAWRIRTRFRSEFQSIRQEFVPDYFTVIVAATLVAGGIGSTFWLADPDHAAETFRTFRWTILVPVVYVLLAMPVITQVELHRKLAFASFLGGAVVAAIIAIFDGLLGGGTQADQITRLSGLAPHPNALALVLVRAAVPAVLLGVVFRDRIERNWLIPGVLVVFVTGLTFSRGAILGLIVGCVLMLALARARRLALSAAGIAILSFGALAVSAPERTLSLLGGGSGSLRLELWSSAVRMIRDSPVTGVGLDQFLYVYLPRYVTPEGWPERFTSHPHNLILDSWLSLGIIGLVFVGMVTVLWIRNVRGGLILHDRIALAAAGGLVAIGIHGLVDQSYFLPELAMSTWLLLILSWPGPKELYDSHPSGEQSVSEG